MKFRSAIAKVLAINPIPIPILNTRIFAMAGGPRNQLATATFKLFIFMMTFYRAMHFSAFARSWDRMSSVCLSVCDVDDL